MKLLTEIYRTPGINKLGRAVKREAVRGIVQEGERILLVYSAQDKAFKFPGGGIEDGENHLEALRREIREECGLALRKMGEPLGRIVEYAAAREEKYDVFQQTSYYYFATVDLEFMGLDLDESEELRGLRPEWVALEMALAQNEAALAGDFGHPPAWGKRETFILRQLLAVGRTK